MNIRTWKQPWSVINRQAGILIQIAECRSCRDDAICYRHYSQFFLLHIYILPPTTGVLSLECYHMDPMWNDHQTFKPPKTYVFFAALYGCFMVVGIPFHHLDELVATLAAGYIVQRLSIAMSFNWDGWTTGGPRVSSLTVGWFFS